QSLRIARRHGGDVVDVALHRLGRAQAIERLDDEVGITQPAEAVVPVTFAAGRLGDRGGVRRDDGAGFLERTQLQRDRRADRLALPFVGNRERPHPVGPVVDRLVEEGRGDRVGRLVERLVRPEDQVQRLREHEGRLVQHIGERGVGGQPQRIGARADEADVIRAGDGMAGFAVVVGGPHPQPDARQAGQRFDPAHDRGGPEVTAELLEARREVGDAQRIAVPVAQHRLDDGGVASIARAALDHALEGDLAEALFLVAGEQVAEDRVAVEARRAPPDDAAERIDQRRDAAVADQAQVERLVVGAAKRRVHFDASIKSATRSIAWRTSAAEANTPHTLPRGRSTDSAMPPAALTASSAMRSVTSSPMKTGRRPRKGSLAIRMRIARALSNPERFTSSTALPGSTTTESSPASSTILPTAVASARASAGRSLKWIAMLVSLSSRIRPRWRSWSARSCERTAAGSARPGRFSVRPALWVR